jgi:hypothetical protein
VGAPGQLGLRTDTEKKECDHYTGAGQHRPCSPTA